MGSVSHLCITDVRTSKLTVFCLLPTPFLLKHEPCDQILQSGMFQDPFHYSPFSAPSTLILALKA
jgi:hypothetical protein